MRTFTPEQVRQLPVSIAGVVVELLGKKEKVLFSFRGIFMSESEYKALRDEILHSYTIVDNSRNILYVTVSCILAFAVTNNSPELYLLPFSVIIPIYMVSINYTCDMYRIGTYIMVFGEGLKSDYKWESRQLHLNTQKENAFPRQFQLFHTPYIVLGFLSFFGFPAFNILSAVVGALWNRIYSYIIVYI